MVLILTDKFDIHADNVIKFLEQENINYFRFNLDVDSLMNTYVSFKNFNWTIRVEEKIIDTENISCVWCRRPFVELTLEEQNDSSVDFKIWKNEWNKTLLGLYNSIKSIPWLNPLRKAYKGENKYYQLEIANKIGFTIPNTLVSNDKDKILNFANNYERILFKLMSQEIYDLGKNDFKGLFTNVISIEELKTFGIHGENPLVLQEYIDKNYEVRYTVVGDRHFVCKIDSQCSNKANLDWRHYDIANTPHIQIEAPNEISVKVNSLMKTLGLEYGALDFIVTPNNNWVFLEINCLGQYLWIEQLTSMPISKAIANWIKNKIKE